MLALCLAMVAPEEQDAFTAFFRRYYGPVLYKSLEIVKNHTVAEDVTQEVFLYAADNYEKFRGRSEGETMNYLLLSAKSRSIDILRREENTMEAADEEKAHAAGEDTEQIVLRRDTIERLLRYIGELDERYRAPLKLRMEGVSCADAALMLGVSCKAVRGRARRGYALLRERMLTEDDA